MERWYFRFGPYFKSIVKQNSDDEYKFICILCSQNNLAQDEVNGFRKDLKQHLNTKTHRRFTHPTKIPNLEKCIGLLAKNPTLKISPDSKESEIEPAPLSGSSQVIETNPLSEINRLNFLFDMTKINIKYHMAFSSFPSLLEDVKNLSSKYCEELIDQVEYSTTTMCKILKDVVGEALFEEIITELNIVGWRNSRNQN